MSKAFQIRMGMLAVLGQINLSKLESNWISGPFKMTIFINSMSFCTKTFFLFGN